MKQVIKFSFVFLSVCAPSRSHTLYVSLITEIVVFTLLLRFLFFFMKDSQNLLKNRISKISVLMSTILKMPVGLHVFLTKVSTGDVMTFHSLIR